MSTGLRVEDEVTEALDRHERRRGRGLPTVSVLAGPPGLALQALRAWSGARGRSLVRFSGLDLDAAIDAWAIGLADCLDLHGRAVDWLARRLGLGSADLDARLGRFTGSERRLFLDGALVDAAGTGLDAIVGRLLDRSPAEPPRPSGEWIKDLRAVVGPGPSLAAGLLDLVPPAPAPVLQIEAAADLDRSASLAAGLVLAEPGLSVALPAEAGRLGAYLDAPPETRTRALLRESIVRVPALDAAALANRLDAARPGLAVALSGPIARLAADGASPALAEAFVAAARATGTSFEAEPEGPDRARSAAERFLFQRLESLPETAGQFRLNVRPGLRFESGRPLEVDLLADSLALAVEVDGYYHFRDPEAYRRDRRKDLLLQRGGFLVVRVLADDIVPRLESTLATILDAVEHQAKTRPRSPEPR